MPQKDNILQELNDLQSSLVNAGSQNFYWVPPGYFDALAEIVLNRIRALDTETAAEELNYLSPLLNNISRKTPYTVPAGYFDSLEETMLLSAQNKIEVQTPAEELELLSPLLSGLKKEVPYSVPDGYFEQLHKKDSAQLLQPGARVISITGKKWFRYAAAAVVIGFITTIGIFFMNNNKAANADPEKIVNKMMKKVSTDDIDEFVQLTDESAPVIASVDVAPESTNEIKELIKDISDTEIQDFLEETQAEEPDTEDTMVN